MHRVNLHLSLALEDPAMKHTTGRLQYLADALLDLHVNCRLKRKQLVSGPLARYVAGSQNALRMTFVSDATEPLRGQSLEVSEWPQLLIDEQHHHVTRGKQYFRRPPHLR